MFRPIIQKNTTLILMAILNLILVYWVMHSTVIEKSKSYNQKIFAAKKMKSALSVLKDFIVSSDMQIFKSIDPNLTGLIFKEESLIRSSDGSLEDKQAALKPNFAAYMVEKFIESGVKAGDTIAVCLTGSNPGANIALYSAVKALDIIPIIITSVSSSTWGATNPDFTWLDMERVLNENDIYNYKTISASLGGKGDCLKRVGNFGGTESRDLIKAAIKRNNINLIPYYINKDSSNLLRSIDYRLNIFESKLNLNNYAVFVNIGGGVSSVGISGVNKLGNNAVYTVDQILKKDLNPSVIRSFAENNVPTINIMRINKIINGVLPIGAKKNKIGEGEIYFIEKYNILIAWISTIISLIMILGIGLYSQQQINDRIKSFNPESAL